MSKREKTDSITHLVKIVAEEVYKKYMSNYKEKIYPHIKELYAQIDKLNTKTPGINHHLESPHCRCIDTPIENDLSNAGVGWDDFEDKLLETELRQAIQKIAISHKRSTRSINSRISQKIVKTNGLEGRCFNL